MDVRYCGRLENLGALGQSPRSVAALLIKVADTLERVVESACSRYMRPRYEPADHLSRTRIATVLSTVESRPPHTHGPGNRDETTRLSRLTACVYESRVRTKEREPLHAPSNPACSEYQRIFSSGPKAARRGTHPVTIPPGADTSRHARSPSLARSFTRSVFAAERDGPYIVHTYLT